MCEAADETVLAAGESAASDFPPRPRGSYSEGLLKSNCWAPPPESRSRLGRGG